MDKKITLLIPESDDCNNLKQAIDLFSDDFMAEGRELCEAQEREEI